MMEARGGPIEHASANLSDFLSHELAYQCDSDEIRDRATRSTLGAALHRVSL